MAVVQAGGSGEVHATAVIDSGSVTRRSHIEGPREYPLEKNP